MRREIFIQNLKCAGCAGTIIRSLSSVAGISDVQVDQENDAVRFNASEDRLVPLAEETLAHLGYPKVDDPNSLLHKAKSFVSCAVGRVGNLMEEEAQS
ncbi:MAG: heavy-metal-associated domain-containing protein [Saprospiraceae bacterium]